MFEQEDSELYYTIEGLTTNAGVSRDKIFALVAKELMDNALDANQEADTTEPCQIDPIGDDGFIIKDNGKGFDPETVADLFSISRSLKSTKLKRLPTCGALGNGLRVVTGAVFATGGSLKITTGGQIMKLTPLADGTTRKDIIGHQDSNGTSIEVHLGPDAGPVDLQWADMALELSSGEQQQYYRGKTSPHWYTSSDFYVLCRAAKNKSLRDLVKDFEGCSSSDNVGFITNGFKSKQATDITLEDAKTLLSRMQTASKEVIPERLGRIGNLKDRSNYVKIEKTFELKSDGEQITIPYIIEAWSKFSDEAEISININRTPITGEVSARHSRTTLWLSGCNLPEGSIFYWIDIGRKPVNVLLNIITPFMPKTNTGKSPDLSYFKPGITIAIQKSTNKAKNNTPKNHNRSQKEIILENIPEGIKKAGNGHSFSIRQLFYVIRPYVNEELKEKNTELTSTYFASVIADYEKETGEDIPGMYRDDRGTLYHPHLHMQIPLGTRMVESYKPPEWTFNKVLYIEKEGLFPVLIDEHWPEKHDCALLTSKGQATRAAKDLLDLLGESDEKLLFFCVHDADAAGTIIYQALKGETRSRGARIADVINLGLDSWEGIALGLGIETLPKPKDRKPVADYAKIYDPTCEKWFQTHRIELNAMSTLQFIDWLDAKMLEHGQGKLIAPADVMVDELKDQTHTKLRQTLIDRILEDGELEERLEEEYDMLRPDIDEAINALTTSVTTALKKNPIQSWREPIANTAADIVETCDY